MRFAANKQGKILAMETDWSVDHGPYSEFGDLLTLRGAQYIGAGYGIPNIRGKGRTVCTNTAGARPSAATARRKANSPPKCSWTCWPRSWAWTL